MTSLGVVPPRNYVGAVESIPDVWRRSARCASRARRTTSTATPTSRCTATRGSAASATWTTRRWSRCSRSAAATRSRPGKKHPLDCLLWQSARPGEPSWATGDPELPDGRPGWHIECAAIALRHLGDGFDVQGGGRDLVFPHHEMSASEGQVLTGSWPFARHYVHGGLVGLDGEKMSKSQGNLVFVSVLRRDGHDPMAVRLALLAHHYRGDWSWTADDLVAAEARLARWRDAVSRPTGPAADGVLAEVRRHLADDLDAPAALAAVDRWAAEAVTRGGPDDDRPRTGAPDRRRPPRRTSLKIVRDVPVWRHAVGPACRRDPERRKRTGSYAGQRPRRW